MASSFSLGAHFEAFVKTQLATGRYGNASEVLRDALRLMEERENRLVALDSAIERGIADFEAGRVRDADEVFDVLEAMLVSLPDEPGYDSWFRGRVQTAIDDPAQPVPNAEVEARFAARRRLALGKNGT